MLLFKIHVEFLSYYFHLFQRSNSVRNARLETETGQVKTSKTAANICQKPTHSYSYSRIGRICSANCKLSGWSTVCLDRTSLAS